MDVRWSDAIHVSAPVENLYAYLSDFSKHPEWSPTLQSIAKIKDDHPSGVDTRYETKERVAFAGKGRRIALNWTMVTVCEVQELVENQRVAWTAKPRPSFGMHAAIAFDFRSADGGGTILTQTLHEHHPGWISWFNQLVFNVSAENIEQQFSTNLQQLKHLLEERLASVPVTAR